MVGDERRERKERWVPVGREMVGKKEQRCVVALRCVALDSVCALAE